MAREKTDAWNYDGLRDRLFGKGQKIQTNYSQEFVKHYSSHDADSDFVLKKSHNKLSLYSEKGFSHMNMADLPGVCDRIEKRKNKDGSYDVVYHFKNSTGEFFAVNNIIADIEEANKGVIIKHKYLVPKTENLDFLNAETIDDIEKEPEYSFNPESSNEGAELLMSDLESMATSNNSEMFPEELALESVVKSQYELPRKTHNGRLITESASSLEGNAILYSNQPVGKNIVVLSAKPFEYPVNFNGSGINVKTKPSGKHQGVFMVSYSAEGDKIEAGQKILEEIAKSN